MIKGLVYFWPAMSKKVTISEANWQNEANEILRVREKVFICEQGISPDIVQDGRDADFFHALARDESGEAIGTGRLSPKGHIGRLSVTIPYRGKGVGKLLLFKLVEIAAEQKMPQVYLNSQTHAIDFYLDAGFISQGPVFMEAGIPHQRMYFSINDADDIVHANSMIFV